MKASSDSNTGQFKNKNVQFLKEGNVLELKPSSHTLASGFFSSKMSSDNRPGTFTTTVGLPRPIMGEHSRQFMAGEGLIVSGNQNKNCLPKPFTGHNRQSMLHNKQSRETSTANKSRIHHASDLCPQQAGTNNTGCLYTLDTIANTCPHASQCSYRSSLNRIN